VQSRAENSAKRQDSERERENGRANTITMEGDRTKERGKKEEGGIVPKIGGKVEEK